MKRKILLVENLFLSPLPLIILIHLLFYITVTHPLMTGWEQQCLSILLWRNTKCTQNPTTIPPRGCRGHGLALLFPLPGVNRSRGTGWHVSSLNGSCSTTGARRWEQNCQVSGEMPRASPLTPTPPPPTDFQNKELPFFHLRQTGCDGRWTGAKSYIPKLHSLSFQKNDTDFWKFPPSLTITEGKVNGCSETREPSDPWRCF